METRIADRISHLKNHPPGFLKNAKLYSILSLGLSVQYGATDQPVYYPAPDKVMMQS
jgi:hypothetical protein